MPRKPLRQKKVPAGPIDVGDRRAPERVEGIEPVEPGLGLPGPRTRVKTLSCYAPLQTIWRERD